MKLDLQGKIGLIFIIYIAIFVLWYIFIYLPKTNGIENTRHEITMLEQLTKSMTDLSATLENEEEKALLKKFNNLLNNLPKADELSKTVDTIKEIGKSKDIKILSLDFKTFKADEEITKSTIEEIPINIIVQGDFFNITEYLITISSFPFFGGYTSLQMQTDEDLYPKVQARFMCIIMTKV